MDWKSFFLLIETDYKTPQKIQSFSFSSYSASKTFIEMK